MTKVLFSTTWGPFKELFFNTSPIDVMNQRFSRGCDIFSLNGHLHVNFAHLIAQNIDVPSVFLEYPHKKDFLAEIDKGYDWVGITAFHNQNDDVIEMCKAIRARSPKSKIVLGGWGAVGLEATMKPDELRGLCDYICHGEGTRYMRTLLGEDPNKPMFHSHLPKWGYSLPMVNHYPRGSTPVVVGSVGCPNKCDFCGTTEMFQHKRGQIMSPEQVHMEFKRAWRENPHILQGVILEEDTFQNIEYITEVGRLLREDTEFGLAYYNFYCLASNRAMSQWDFTDMALTGCSTVFVGVESFLAKQHGYGKTEGRTYKETFSGLHNVGINTTGAWIVGFDFQNRQNIEEDLQGFIDLYPTMQQLTRICPFPPTPMWDRMKEEGRIREDWKWEDVSFYGGGGMKLQNFYEHEIAEIIDRGYKQLYETHGASMARIIHVSLMGYKFCMENRHKNKYLEQRAIFHRRQAYTFFPIVKALEIYAPNNHVRKKMKDLRRLYIELLGEPTSFQKIIENALTMVSGVTRLVDLLKPQDNFLVEEAYKKYIYDKPAPRYPERPYRVEYPRRTPGFKLNQYVKGALRSAIMTLDKTTRSLDPNKERYLPQIPPGGFNTFL